MAADDHRGTFVWYELMTTDPEGAKASYSEIAGWGTQDSDMSTGPYTMFTRAEQPVAGSMELPE